VSKTKMPFLDTTTTVKEGNMTTDLYSKPTDKHQYLSPSSCHPKHSLYSRRSFLLISLAFENPLSITLSLYPRFFK
jgi:hypothetical protein